eukprot:408756-Rhodomonas_salina.1
MWSSGCAGGSSDSQSLWEGDGAMSADTGVWHCQGRQRSSAVIDTTQVASPLRACPVPHAVLTKAIPLLHVAYGSCEVSGADVPHGAVRCPVLTQRVVLCYRCQPSRRRLRSEGRRWE